MHEGATATVVITTFHFIAQILLIIRVLLRPAREAASRIAWTVVILSLPLFGMAAYLLLGETSIGRKRIERMKWVIDDMESPDSIGDSLAQGNEVDVPARHTHLFKMGSNVNGFQPVGGNRAELMADSNASIDAIVTDIDQARKSVHLLFYIWLADNNGLKIASALQRAAGRGVTCRVLVDDLGSRGFIHSCHWKALQHAGVKVCSALSIGNPLLRPLKGRIDLRNHRKIVVVDNSITYCGSQNCADPEFRVKAKYAPWVDILVRFQGPIVLQNQYLFGCDWQAGTGENIGQLLSEIPQFYNGGFSAQVIGTGPTVRTSAMPEMFVELISSARKKLVITTPYYVPNEAMQSALCASARRGVDTTIIFPKVNDSWIVGAASRSFYHDLLAAGVKIYEYEGGLLHTKSLTCDDEVSLIGSANMDRRSFDLNYENNILLYDVKLTADILKRQNQYLAHSTPVTQETVSAWKWYQRLLNNTVAMFGPVL